MILRLAVMLCSLAAVGRSCDCVGIPAPEARRYSEVVFRGMVVRYRHTEKGDPMVVFQVSRVWKGPVTAEFEMLAVQADSCFSFYPGLLRLGNELLVYAKKIDGTDYFPMPCNTTLVQDAKDILKLGLGRKPKSK